MSGICAVQRRQLTYQDSIDGDTVEHEMVQREIDPVVVLSQPDQSHTKQRRNIHIEPALNILSGESNCLRVTLLGWQVAEIVERQMHLNIRIDLLTQQAIVQRERGSPDLVPPHNFVEAALQHCWIQWSPFVDGHSFVVSWDSLCQLGVKPNLLLAWRQRSRRVPGSSDERFRLRAHRLQFAAAEALDQPAPGFRGLRLVPSCATRGLVGKSRQFLRRRVEANMQTAQPAQAQVLPPDEILRR